MNAKRRILYPTLALLVLGSSLVAVAPAQAACDPAGKEAIVEATSKNVEALVACGLEAQSSLSFGPDGTLPIEIPAAGESIALFATYAQGTSGVDTAIVTTFKDGGIGFAYEAGGKQVVGGDAIGIEKLSASLASRTTSSSSPASAALASGCTSSSYSTMGYFQVSSYHYSINTVGIPAGGAARINAAASAVAAASDNCGLAGSTGIPAVYDGTTTYTTNVTFNGGCNAQDGYSVQKLGSLSSTVVPIAITCTQPNGAGWVLHTDTVYKNSVSWYASSSLTGCTGAKYDLQGVATHEIGHAYGLGHAGDATQVMYSSVGYCDTGDRLLGSGDHAGLMAIY